MNSFPIFGGGNPSANSIPLVSSFTPSNTAITSLNAGGLSIQAAFEFVQGQINALAIDGGAVTSVNGCAGAVVLNAGNGLSFVKNDDSTGTFSLTATGVTADSYGNVAQTPYITVNEYGQITDIEMNNIAIDLSQLNSSDYTADNTVETLVYRDEFGNFHANDIYADGAFYSNYLDAQASANSLYIGNNNANIIYLGSYNDFSGSNCSIVSRAQITLMNEAGTYPLPINNVYIKQPSGGATLDLANGSTLQLSTGFGLSFVPDRNCTVNYNLVETISFNQSLQTTDSPTFVNVTANNIYSLFANNSLTPGLDQLVLTIDTNVEIWYDGTNQQLYLLNNSSSSITCTFLVGYFAASTVTGLTYVNSSQINVAANASYYFSSDGSSSSGYNINTAGYLQNIHFLTITIGSNMHKITGNMNYDGTYNNILLEGV